MSNQNKELSSLDKLKNLLLRKAVKDAKGLEWLELPIKISGCTRFGTSYDIYRNVYSNLYILKYNNSFIRVCNTIEEAKEIAERDYKNKLKECLR